ncbi:MAG: carbon-nitrogen hydrolase family protein [Deltaproteobacteria bacterium]|nr:carbon-nitrogen hydrolase family protein [Deltaproteobacteria bacterium]
MDLRTISTIALPMTDEPSLETKLDHAMELVKFALQQGAGLVCLPELANRFRGNTPATADQIKSEDYALDENAAEVRPFYDIAKKHGVSIVLPLLIKAESGYFNRALFINEQGEISGRYDKIFLAPGEADEGVIRGNKPVVVDWQGIKVGFMICFDMNYQELVVRYKELGAKLIVFSSMFGGGKLVNSYALLHGLHFVCAYSDWSRFVDPFGNDYGGVGTRLEAYRFGSLPPVLTRSINFDYERVYITDAQAAFSEITRKYGSKVKMEFEQGSAITVMESLSDQFTIQDIMNEFDIGSMDDHIDEHRVPLID